MSEMANQKGNGGRRPAEPGVADGTRGTAIPMDSLVRLAQATPEQRALVDAILAGKLPVVAPPAAATPAEPEAYIGKGEAARRLGIKPRTLDAWIADGRIPFYKVARSVRVRWSEVQAHLAATSRVCRRG